MKRIMTIALLLCLLLTVLPAGVLAAEGTDNMEETETAIVREPGMCGEDMRWSYDSGTLTIYGTGAMDDYPDGSAPWLEHQNNIKKVVFTGGVTYIGEGAFADYDNLEAVDFGGVMHTIGKRAFKGCDGLTVIVLPDTFRKFDEECFMSCKNLTEIYCRGGMPSFRGNCIWDVYATIYYPQKNAWPAEPVAQLQSAFHNRVEFRIGEPETAEAALEVTLPPETTRATEPTVAETVPAETRDVVTVVMTESTEPMQTTAPETVPETETVPQETKPAEVPVWETVPPTEPVEAEKHLGSLSGIVVFGALLAGIISFMLLGALLFRRRRY